MVFICIKPKWVCNEIKKIEKCINNVYIFITVLLTTVTIVSHKNSLEERKEMFLFNDALNTFYFYGYMASDIWYIYISVA